MWGRGVLPATLPVLFSATLSPALSVYLCVNVGLQGLLVVRLPAPFIPHSASLGPTTATRVLSAPPTGLDECLFFISLVSDFLVVPFSVSSGCARRRSVYTYATILFLLLFSFVDYVPVKGEIIWYLSLTARLISLSIMLSSSIHAVAKGTSSFFFSAQIGTFPILLMRKPGLKKQRPDQQHT